MKEYGGPERRIHPSISDEDMEKIATRAAEKALEKVYAEVGRGILHKLAWFAGVAAVAVLMWMGGKGIQLK